MLILCQIYSSQSCLFPFCRLPLQSNVLPLQYRSILSSGSLTCWSFFPGQLGYLFRKSLPEPISWSILPTFSSRNSCRGVYHWDPWPIWNWLVHSVRMPASILLRIFAFMFRQRTWHTLFFCVCILIWFFVMGLGWFCRVALVTLLLYGLISVVEFSSESIRPLPFVGDFITASVSSLFIGLLKCSYLS